MNNTVKVTTWMKSPGVYRLRAEMPRLPGEPRKQQCRYVRCTAKELPHQVSLYHVEMQTLANTLLNAAGMLTAGALPATTLEQYALDWLAQREKLKSFSANTLSQYRNLLLKHIIPTWGALELAKVDRQAVLAGFAKLAGGGLASSTLHHIRSRLAALINDASREGHRVIKDVTHKLPLQRATIQVTRVLSEEQLQRLMTALDGNARLGPIIRCLLYTGMRRGEACGLRWGDIDLTRGKVTINRALAQIDNGAVVVKLPKTNSSRRTISLPKAGLVEKQMMHQRAAKVAEEIGFTLHDVPVFLSDSGEAWRPSQLTQAVAALRDSLDIPELTVHLLRHTHATRLLRLNSNIKAVARRLGHEDPTMLLRIYAHVIDQDDATLAETTHNDLATFRAPTPSP